ncbi:MAG TPA: serine/threonine protein kinase [Polyangiales bacterium]|nr:serine/threonine protein kinase [Polyangiales bacterium]
MEAPEAHIACAARPHAFELPEWIGPYPILRAIGSGGMGSVYAGKQHCPAREVAIKVIKDGIFADEALRQKFLSEREIAGSFEHPNIIRVYVAGEDEDGQLYYVMELAERGTLREFLRTESLSTRDAVRLMVEVSFAVDYAHKRGVLHRDLKPDNILIGEDRRPRVTDFGVARRLADETDPLTAPSEHTLVGCYPYMAPEQAGYSGLRQPSASSEREPNAAADVYGLGAILYELVHGTPPYPVHTREQLFAAFASGPPPALQRWGYGPDYDLEAVVMKALDHDAAQRYSTAAEFAEDLRRTLGRRAPVARPHSLRGRLVSALSHHAAWFSILVAALVISVASFGSLKQREQTHFTQQTQRTAGVIGLIFAHAASVTRMLAIDPMSSSTLSQWRVTHSREETWLARIAADNKLISSVFLLTMDGTPVAHYPPEPDRYYQQRLDSRGYFKGARLSTPQGTDLGAFVSPLFRSRASDGLIKLAFSAPVYGVQRQQLGVAVVTVALEKLTDAIDLPLSLVAPCERDLTGRQNASSRLVCLERDARGDLVEPTTSPRGETIRGDVARTHYQVVADLQQMTPFASRDRLLLGMMALLCLCALALFLFRRALADNAA